MSKKSLFCIEIFSNFAPVNKVQGRGEMTKAPDQTTPTPPTQEGKKIPEARESATRCSWPN